MQRAGQETTSPLLEHAVTTPHTSRSRALAEHELPSPSQLSQVGRALSTQMRTGVSTALHQCELKRTLSDVSSSAFPPKTRHIPRQNSLATSDHTVAHLSPTPNDSRAKMEMIPNVSVDARAFALLPTTHASSSLSPRRSLFAQPSESIVK